MAKFTIFARPDDDITSILIIPSEGEDPETAKKNAMGQMNDLGFEQDDMHIIGVVGGDINVLEWDDQV